MTLSAQSLSKRYGAASACAAVRDASLDVGRGDFISIVGRSGSGKSTLMAMLGALTKPTQGRQRRSPRWPARNRLRWRRLRLLLPESRRR